MSTVLNSFVSMWLAEFSMSEVPLATVADSCFQSLVCLDYYCLRFIMCATSDLLHFECIRCFFTWIVNVTHHLVVFLMLVHVQDLNYHLVFLMNTNTLSFGRKV